MNKTAIKRFAMWARKELIEKSTQRAKIYGIEKNKEMKDMDTALNGQVLTKNEKDARKILIENNILKNNPIKKRISINLFLV